MNNKLLILGNGFDLHLHLKSGFNSFLKSLTNEYPIASSLFGDISSSNHPERFKTSSNSYLNPIDYITSYTEYVFYNSDEKAIPTNSKLNFWHLYFNMLNAFPEFDNGDGIFSENNASISLNNWNDIEFQIQYILEISEDIINKYKECIYDNLEYADGHAYSNETKSLLKEYESMFMRDDRITFNGVLCTHLIYFSLISGWSPYQNIYDFLLKELEDFEITFKDYLTKQVSKTDYKIKASSFAKNLAGENYNLINFNYTTFYDLNDTSKTNIHSTLDDNGHPIFGISSVVNDELVYKKPYYKFSKTFRIMKISEYDKNTLPDNIDEIIFYGHSLSHADYSYFEAIMKKYNLLNSNIILTFKYSNFENKGILHDELPNQVTNVYKLLNNIIKGNDSIFEYLIMDKRIRFQKI